jgi:hypothetical protein
MATADSAPAKTAEWRNVDLKTLRGEIIPRDRPAVLKGLVEHWPIVRASAQSDSALYDYIRARDLGRPVRILVVLWWHYVEALEPVNLSVNYWRLDAPEMAEPFAALAHGLMAITPLSASRRELWRKMFDHYVFQTSGDPVPHLPPDRRGMLGSLSPELQSHIRTQLIRSLTKPMPAQLKEQILRLLWPVR